MLDANELMPPPQPPQAPVREPSPYGSSYGYGYPEPAPAGTPLTHEQPLTAPVRTLADGRREAMILNRTADPYKRARELAEEQIRKYQKEGEDYDGRHLTKASTWFGEKVFKALNKKKFHLLEEYYRQKWTEDAASAMLTNNNSYLEMDLLRGAVTDATRKVAEEREAGKSKVGQKQLEEDIKGAAEAGVTEATGTIKDEMLASVIRPAIEAVQAGTPMTEEALQKVLAQFVEDHKDDPLIKDIFGENATEFGVRARYFASNITELATQVAGDIASHRYALDQLDAHIALKVSSADWARSTVVNRGKSGEVIDKLIAFGRHNRVGGYLLNPATAGAVWSVGSYAITSAARKAGMAGSLALVPFAPVVSPMLVSGSFAAMRRWREVKVDRAMHMGEMAYGASIDPNDGKVRQEMEDTAYGTARIQELIDGGGQDVARGGRDREALQAMLRRARTEPANTDLRNDLLSRAAEIRARLDETQIDRIRYSGREVIEQERFELVRNVVEIRRALRSAGMTDAEVDTNIRNFQNIWEDHLNKDIQDQDHKFRRYQAREVGKAFAKGAATGLLVGFASREVGDTFLHIAGDPTRPLLLDKLRHLVDSEGGTRSVLSRISDFVGGTSIRPNLHDVQEMYVAGGDFEAGHYTVNIDPGNHALHILDNSLPVDPTTGLPPEVLDDLNIIVDQNGNITLSGGLDPNMHDELQDVLASLKQEGFHVTPFTHAELSGLPPIEQTLLADAGDHLDMTPGFATKIPDGTKWIQEGATGAWKLVIEGHEDIPLVEHVQFDANGHIIPGTFIRNPDFDQGLIDIREGSIKTVSPDEMLKKWDSVGKGIDQRQWYAYDQAGSQNNELTAYTIKQDKVLVLDMSKMTTAWQRGLNPNPIHVPDYFHAPASPEDGMLGWAFSLPGHAGKPIFIPDGIDGSWDGYLHLDPDSTAVVPNTGGMTLGEVTNMIVDQKRLSELPNGNIATEYYSNVLGENRRDVFKLGLGGRMGTFEAGRMVEQDGKTIFQAFATGLGNGELGGEMGEIPQIDLLGDLTQDLENVGYHIQPPTDFGPMIVAGHAGRRPMEKLVPGTARERLREPIPSPYGYYGTGESLRIDRSRGLPVRNADYPTDISLDQLLFPLQVGTAGYSGATSDRSLRIEGSDIEGYGSALEDIRQASNIYFALPYHIGDTLITLGYVNGTIAKIRKINPEATVHLYVPKPLYDLLKPLEDEHLSVVKGEQVEPRANPSSPDVSHRYPLKALEQIVADINSKPDGEKAVVFDFENIGIQRAEVIRAQTPHRRISLFSGLFPTTFAYGNYSDGTDRYRNFASDLLNDTDPGDHIPETRIPLPSDAAELYEGIANRFGIIRDDSRPQISVVLESGSTGRQYSIEQWGQVAANIQATYPDVQFNFITNPNKPADDPTLVDPSRVEQAIRDNGLTSARIVSGSIPELVSLFNRQKLILSNDGGILHIAAATESSPKVIGLFFEGFPNHWMMDSNRVIPISAPEARRWEEVWGETDESAKVINLIQPQVVSDQAIRVLRSYNIPRSRSVPVPAPAEPPLVEPTVVDDGAPAPGSAGPAPDLAPEPAPAHAPDDPDLAIVDDGASAPGSTDLAPEPEPAPAHVPAPIPAPAPAPAPEPARPPSRRLPTQERLARKIEEAEADLKASRGRASTLLNESEFREIVGDRLMVGSTNFPFDNIQFDRGTTDRTPETRYLRITGTIGPSTDRAEIGVILGNRVITSKKKGIPPIHRLEVKDVIVASISPGFRDASDDIRYGLSNILGEMRKRVEEMLPDGWIVDGFYLTRRYEIAVNVIKDVKRSRGSGSSGSGRVEKSPALSAPARPGGGPTVATAPAPAAPATPAGSATAVSAPAAPAVVPVPAPAAPAASAPPAAVSAPASVAGVTPAPATGGTSPEDILARLASAAGDIPPPEPAPVGVGPVKTGKASYKGVAIGGGIDDGTIPSRVLTPDDDRLQVGLPGDVLPLSTARSKGFSEDVVLKPDSAHDDAVAEAGHVLMPEPRSIRERVVANAKEDETGQRLSPEAPVETVAVPLQPRTEAERDLLDTIIRTRELATMERVKGNTRDAVELDARADALEEKLRQRLNRSVPDGEGEQDELEYGDEILDAIRKDRATRTDVLPVPEGDGESDKGVFVPVLDPEPVLGDDIDDDRDENLRERKTKGRGGIRPTRHSRGGPAGEEDEDPNKDVLKTIAEALETPNSHKSTTVNVDERRMGELFEGIALDPQGTIVLSGVREMELVDGPPGKRKIGLGGTVTYASLSSSFAISFRVTDKHELEVTDVGVTKGALGGQLYEMRDDIEPGLRNIIQLLKDSLGTKIPSGRTVTSIKLVGNKLQLKFGRKTS